MKKKSAEEGTWLDRNVSSSFLLCSGFLFSLIIIMERNLYIKAGQFLFLVLASVLLNKPLGILNKLVLFFFIVVFNLLSPAGKIIVRVFSFPITMDALKIGIEKALNIVSLFYLSKIVVRDDILFPGQIGRLIGRTLGFFTRLTTYWKGLKVKDLFKDIDEVFITVYGEDPIASRSSRGKNSPLGIFVIGIIFLLNLLFLYFLN